MNSQVVLSSSSSLVYFSLFPFPFPSPSAAVPDPLSDYLADTSAESGQLFLDLVVRYFANVARGDGPVSSACSPSELGLRFDEPLPRHGTGLAEVVARLEREFLADSNRLSHPMYMGHQVSAPLPAGVWTEMVTAAINGSTAVAEMSPAGTAIEHRVIRWMNDLAGFGSAAGGTFVSGGTEATFSALLASRAAALPDAWQRGVGAVPPVVVYGENAHYAVTRAIGMLGIGMQAGVAVPSRDWKLDPLALRATLDRLSAEGRSVMAVVATAGSTPTGAFDDLVAIGSLCAERNLWLHVDGAHGASALLSTTHQHRLQGLHHARSIAWDPHKMMLLPLAAGVVLVRQEHDLEQAFTQRAPYLFHGGDDRVWDQGVRSFQCSRRLDALKVWVALQRYGSDGIGKLYDQLCQMALALYQLIGDDPRFEAIHTPECNILCFRYVGDRSRSNEQLDRLNRDLRERYNQSGRGWITTTVLGDRRVLRVTIMNPRTSPAHLERLLSGLAEAAAEV